MSWCRSRASFTAAACLVASVITPAARPSAASASPATFHLLEASIDDVHDALASGHLTCRALVDLYLKRIEAYDKSGPHLNAVQTVNLRARGDADRLDRAFTASGSTGRLHCIPVLVKDQIETSTM